jgi:hypothetical protein
MNVSEKSGRCEVRSSIAPPRFQIIFWRLFNTSTNFAIRRHNGENAINDCIKYYEMRLYNKPTLSLSRFCSCSWYWMARIEIKRYAIFGRSSVYAALHRSSCLRKNERLMTTKLTYTIPHKLTSFSKKTSIVCSSVTGGW